MRRSLAAGMLALAFPASAFAWGGTYAAGDGQSVRIEVSDSYPVDPAVPQATATYLGSLVHGQELARLTVNLWTYPEVQAHCGRRALACYNPSEQTIYTTPEDQPGQDTAQHVLAHEYGHHVATNRINAPWRAEDWGTKRWASYVNVCARTVAGELHPGNEGEFYTSNPGEAFAETYRVLNEKKAGATSTSWDVVNDNLFPDDTALELLEQDVVSPYTGPTVSTLRGSFGAGVARAFALKTPIDGTLVLALRPPATAKLRLSLYAGSKLVGRGASVRYAVCGRRALTLKVDRLSGRGAFTVALSKP